MDTVVEELQIAFKKLKAGIDAFGDDLQKVRSRSLVSQGATQCLIMKFIHILTLILIDLPIGVQCEYKKEESLAESSVSNYQSSEFSFMNRTGKRPSPVIRKSGASFMYHLPFRLEI